MFMSKLCIIMHAIIDYIVLINGEMFIELFENTAREE